MDEIQVEGFADGQRHVGVAANEWVGRGMDVFRIFQHAYPFRFAIEEICDRQAV